MELAQARAAKGPNRRKSREKHRACGSALDENFFCALRIFHPVIL